MKDKQGREYAKLSQLKAGDIVWVDDGFDCMKRWSPRVVIAEASDYRPGNELYIKCKSGMHGLEGQLTNDNDSLIGIYAEDPRK